TASAEFTLNPDHAQGLDIGTQYTVVDGTAVPVAAPRLGSGDGVCGVLGPLHASPVDFDGDARADVTVFRPSTGAWLSRTSSTGYGSSTSVSWGLSTDVPVPGDYDGDG